MGVSRSDSNKVIQRLKKETREKRSKKKALFRQSHEKEIIQGREMSKKKLKKKEQRERLVKREFENIKNQQKAELEAKKQEAAKDNDSNKIDIWNKYII
ncbi:hypothetical protein K502DRAFT_368063 [Neoconidiobolus thromboides FSU 785]|nr:hypothetical protein K502DRAFT_368063 [Neoconidiobolus thromboides FSU 785]